jgi:hypothetical protein
MDKRRDSDNGTYPTWKWLAGLVIGLLIMLIAYFMGGNIDSTKADAKEMRIKLDATCDRVTKLETNYDHIIKSLDENKQFVQRTERVLIRLEKKNGDR